MNLRFYLRGLGIGIVVTSILMGYTLNNRKDDLTDEEIRQRAEALGMVDDSGTLISDASGDDGDNDPLQDQGREAGNITVISEPEDQDEVSSKEPAEGEEKPESSEPDTNAPSLDNEPSSSEDELKGDASLTADPEKDETPDLLTEPEKTEGSAKLSVSGGVGQDSSFEELKEAEPEKEKDSEKEKQEEKDPEKEKSEDEETGSVSQKKDTLSGSGSITVKKGYDSTAVARELESAGIISDAADFDSYLVRRGKDRYISVGSFNIPSGADYDQISKIITGR